MSDVRESVGSARTLEGGAAALKRWRDECASVLAQFRRWALVARLIDETSAARLAHLERRLAADRLEIAVVGSHAAQRCLLVDALLYRRLGAALLRAEPGRAPLCPLEIGWAESQPASLRLLAIESREGELSLREHLQDTAQWKEMPLDAGDSGALASALEALSEKILVTPADAATLGFPAEGAERVEVPRWRYAVANIPHPLLATGVAILVAPEAAVLEREPELSRNRIPGADAVVHLATAMPGGALPALEPEIARMSELGDALARILVSDPGEDAPEALARARLREQASALAESLSIDPNRVLECAPPRALAEARATEAGASGVLAALEGVLARVLLRRRREDHVMTLRAELRPLLTEARALLDGRATFMGEQVEQLEALKGRNQKLLEALARKAGEERGRLDQARQALVGLRGVYNRHADALAAVLSPVAAREEANRARAAIEATAFGSGVGEIVDAYFAGTRERLGRGIAAIAEVRTLIANMNRKFESDLGLRAEATEEFATERFVVELDRLEAQAAADLKGAGARLARRAALASLFVETIAIKAVTIFEIADREVRAWMGSFIRPLDAHVTGLQERASGRLDGMGRIESAESDLLKRIGELRGLLAEVDARSREWEAHYARFTKLLGGDLAASRPPSGAARPGAART